MRADGDEERAGRPASARRRSAPRARSVWRVPSQTL